MSMNLKVATEVGIYPCCRHTKITIDTLLNYNIKMRAEYFSFIAK